MVYKALLHYVGVIVIDTKYVQLRQDIIKADWTQLASVARTTYLFRICLKLRGVACETKHSASSCFTHKVTGI